VRVLYRRKTLSIYRQKAGKYWLKKRGDSILREILAATFFLGGIVVVCGVMVYLFSVLYSMPWLETRSVVVRGLNELTEREVLNVAGVRKGVNILAVNTRLVADKVKAIPWVKEVYVGREYPDRIVINVKERTAIAMMKRGDEIYLIDRDGSPFKKFSPSDGVDLPILTGFTGEGAGQSALLAKALSLVEYLKSHPGIASIESISEIHGDDRLGLTIFTTTGMCLVLGFSDYESKLNHLPLILADLERKNMRTAFLRIDLSDPMKVTVQPRKIPLPKQPKTAEGEVKI